MPADVSYLTSDVPCHRCHYNLRGMAPDSACPECAYSVASSLAVSNTLPHWLRTVARIYVIALLSGAVLFFLALTAAPLVHDTSPWFSHLYAGYFLVSAFLALAGTLCLCLARTSRQSEPIVGAVFLALLWVCLLVLLAPAFAS